MTKPGEAERSKAVAGNRLKLPATAMNTEVEKKFQEPNMTVPEENQGIVGMIHEVKHEN